MDRCQRDTHPSHSISTAQFRHILPTLTRSQEVFKRGGSSERRLRGFVLGRPVAGEAEPAERRWGRGEGNCSSSAWSIGVGTVDGRVSCFCGN